MKEDNYSHFQPCRLVFTIGIKDYSGNLNAELVQFSNGRKEVGCQMILVFKCHMKTGQPIHLNTWQMDAILFSYVLVWYWNGWSSTKDIDVNRPFEYWTIWNPNFKKVGIQMVGIQIPTVVHYSDLRNIFLSRLMATWRFGMWNRTRVQQQFWTSTDRKFQQSPTQRNRYLI